MDFYAAKRMIFKMEIRNPKFSVLIPVYNAEKHLQECIDSVEKQTCQDFEIVIVDDGSTDHSGEICDTLSMVSLSEIRVIHQSNKGQYWARREAILHSDGEYCIFLDADDFLYENALERIERIIDQYSADLIIYNLSYISDNGSIENCPNEFPEGMITKESLLSKICATSTLNSLCIKACKRSIVSNDLNFSNYGITVTRLGEDLLQSLPIIESSEKIYYLSEHLYYYRKNPESTTQKYNLENYKSLNSARRYLFSYLELLNYNTTENLSLFFNYYAKLFIVSLKELLLSSTSKQNILDAFYEIAEFPLIKQLFLCKRYSTLSILEKAGLYLFSEKHYWLFIGLRPILKWLKSMKDRFRYRKFFGIYRKNVHSFSE